MKKYLGLFIISLAIAACDRSHGMEKITGVWMDVERIGKCNILFHSEVVGEIYKDGSFHGVKVVELLENDGVITFKQNIETHKEYRLLIESNDEFKLIMKIKGESDKASNFIRCDGEKSQAIMANIDSYIKQVNDNEKPSIGYIDSHE